MQIIHRDIHLEAEECESSDAAETRLCEEVHHFLTVTRPAALADPARVNSKMLILVQSAEMIPSVRSRLENDPRVRAALREAGVSILTASSKQRDSIVPWCTDAKINFSILIGTTVVGAGVSNKQCDVVIHYGGAYHVDGLLQGMGRAGRSDERKVTPRSLVLFVQQQMNSVCGAPGSAERNNTVRMRKQRIGTDAATIKVASPTGVEEYVRATTCRRTVLASK